MQSIAETLLLETLLLMRYGCPQMWHPHRRKVKEGTGTRMTPQTDIVSVTRKGSPCWTAEEGRERIQRIEARKGRRNLVTRAEIENGMRGLAIGNEIGSAREFANENEKGILQGKNMIVSRLGKGRKREKEKRKKKERRNASAKGTGTGKRNESVKRKRNENAKRRKYGNAKEKWRRNENATVKKTAIDTARENGNGIAGAIDTTTGNAESERRNAKEKEIVQGSMNWSGRREKKFPKPKQRIRWETRNCINHRKGSQWKEGEMRAALTTARIEMEELQERRKD